METLKPSGAFDAQNEPDVHPLSGTTQPEHAATATATEEADTDAPELFTADDLAILDARNEAPKELEEATRLLVDFCLEPKNMYGNGNGNPYFGRFSFCEYEKTAAQTRALFRLLRQSLDFLNADYLACEEEEREHLRARLAAFEQLRGEKVAA